MLSSLRTPRRRLQHLAALLSKPLPVHQASPFISSWRPRAPLLSLALHTSPPVLATPKKMNVFRRAHKFLLEDPLAKVSLVFGGALFAVLLIVEFFTKKNKEKVPISTALPPSVGHKTVQRASELRELESKLKKAAGHTAPPLVAIVGPPGSGKTQLVHHFAREFCSRPPKRLFSARKPIVLTLNGSSDELLEASVREAAYCLGLKQSDDEASSVNGNVVAVFKSVQSKLASLKSQWLLVVDNLSSSSSPLVPLLLGKWEREGKGNWRRGSILVTSLSSPDTRVPVLLLQPRLKESESMELLSSLLEVESLDGECLEASMKLCKELEWRPLDLALAGSTIKLYSTFIEGENEGDPFSLAFKSYSSLLSEKASQSVSDAALALYLEAAGSHDLRVWHAMDLFVSCDLQCPIPRSLVERHLSNPFYGLQPVAPPPFGPMGTAPPTPPPEEKSLVTRIKEMLPFGSGSATTPDASLPLPGSSREGSNLGILFESPLLSFCSSQWSGMETVQVHPRAADIVVWTHFLRETVPRMERTYLRQAEERFNRGTWFRKYRAFNPAQSLEKYYHSLPGVSAAGVVTSEQYRKMADDVSSSMKSFTGGVRLPRSDAGLDYRQYLQLVSHYHRVVAALVEELKSTTGDLEDTQLKMSLRPHIHTAKQFPLLSKEDKLDCRYALATIEAVSTLEHGALLKEFQGILADQRALFGSRHPSVAQTLTDMAEQDSAMGNASSAKQRLMEAVRIHESHLSSRKRESPRPLEYGLTLKALGIVHSGLGESELCRDALERALEQLQVIPPDGNVTNTQKKLVASLMTDVAHAHLFLGNPVAAKRFVDVALLAHRNIHSRAHPELARTLTVLSMVHALLGDREESRKARQEAGEVQNQLQGPTIQALAV